MTGGRSLAAAFLAAISVSASAGQGQDAALLITAAREALGGDAALTAITSFTVTGSHTRSVGISLTSSADIKCALPDRFVRQLDRTMGGPPIGFFSVTEYDGFNRDEPIKDIVAPESPRPVFIPAGPAPRTPDEVAAERQRLANQGKHIFAALTLPLFVASFAGYALDFTAGGRVQLPAGPADALVVKGADGFTWRLYLDGATHLPVRLTWMAKPIVIGSVTSTVAVNPQTGAVRSSSAPPVLPANPTAGLPDVIWEMSIGDYRSEGGINWPHRLITTFDGKKHEELGLGRFRMNPAINPKVFTPRAYAR